MSKDFFDSSLFSVYWAARRPWWQCFARLAWPGPALQTSPAGKWILCCTLNPQSTSECNALKCTAAAQFWYAFPLHLAVNWLPPTPPTAHQPQSTGKFPALSLVPDLSPEMMTHSLGPQVWTFPMVSPVHRSLKWGKPLPTSKTASPVGASVTARAFGLAVEECGMTSEVGGGGDQLHLGLATGRHSTDSASQKRATHKVYFLLSSLLPP